MCPVVASFVRKLNDSLPDDASRTRLLAPLLPRLVETRATADIARRRAFFAVDWTVRQFCAAQLEAMGLHPVAPRLRQLAPVVDAESAFRALRTAVEARAASGFAIPCAVLWTLEEILRGAWVEAADKAADAATVWLVWRDEEQRASWGMAIDLVEQMIALGLSQVDGVET